MQFGEILIESAEGTVLAHSRRIGTRTLRKGRVLSAEDVGALREAGVPSVVAARMEENEIGENEAAVRVATRCAGPHVRSAAAFTGRVNLFAEANGVVLVNEAAVQAVNSVHESITLATVTPRTPVRRGQMLATIKIIPFAAPGKAVETVERRLAVTAPIAVAPFKPQRAALISTLLPDTKPSLAGKAHDVLNARLESLGSMLAMEWRTAHEPRALAQAMREAREAGLSPILVVGASAITDRRDVIPAALVEAGGEILHFGMPVDPGNLLLLGRLGKADVIGLPGCARSPRRNGCDFVLERLAAGLPVGKRELASMGVGGLLAETAGRLQRRNIQEKELPRAPKIAAVILAAGHSSRMGTNKLLADAGGKPLICRVAEATLVSAAEPVIVVTGSEAEKIKTALDGLNIVIVNNSYFSNGLSTSLRVGIKSVPDGCDGGLILLGDMPDISATLLDRMIAGFDPAEGRAICVATHRGKWGNPVLWARRFFDEMAALEGDVGAKHIIAQNADLVCEIEAGSDAPLLDLDTPADLDAWRAR